MEVTSKSVSRGSKGELLSGINAEDALNVEAKNLENNAHCDLGSFAVSLFRYTEARI